MWLWDFLFGRPRTPALVAPPFLGDAAVALDDQADSRATFDLSVVSDRTLVQFDEDGSITLDIKSIPEAKLAIKTIRLRKKELQLEKRQVSARAQQLRAEYSDWSRRQGPAMRGGGGIGKFVRAVQSSNKAGKRADVANALGPLENQKARLNSALWAADKALLRIDAYLEENAG